jgi:hypothetical protein
METREYEFFAIPICGTPKICSQQQFFSCAFDHFLGLICHRIMEQINIIYPVILMAQSNYLNLCNTRIIATRKDSKLL